MFQVHHFSNVSFAAPSRFCNHFRSHCCLWSKRSWEIPGKSKLRSSRTTQGFSLGKGVRPPESSPNSSWQLSMILLASEISSLRWQRSISNSLAFVCSLIICSKESTLWLMIKNCRKSWVKSTRPLTWMWQRSGTSHSMEWASKRNGWRYCRIARRQEKMARRCSLRNYLYDT